MILRSIQPPVQPPLPLNTIGQDSLCPAPHPLPSPHLANLSTLSVPAADRISTVMQLDLKPIPPHKLVGLVSLGKPIAPHSPTPSASEDPGSEASVIIITGMSSIHHLLSEELTLQCRLRYCSRYHFYPHRPTRTRLDQAIGTDSWYAIRSGGMAEDCWWLLGAPPGGETWSPCRRLALSPSPPNQAALEAHWRV